MSDLRYWKCSHCQGSGEVIVGFNCDTIEKCERCDGTGNAMVDGAAPKTPIANAPKPSPVLWPNEDDLKRAIATACDKLTSWEYQLEYKLSECRSNNQVVYVANLETQLKALRKNIATLRAIPTSSPPVQEGQK